MNFTGTLTYDENADDFVMNGMTGIAATYNGTHVQIEFTDEDTFVLSSEELMVNTFFGGTFIKAQGGVVPSFPTLVLTVDGIPGGTTIAMALLYAEMPTSAESPSAGMATNSSGTFPFYDVELDEYFIVLVEGMGETQHIYCVEMFGYNVPSAYDFTSDEVTLAWADFVDVAALLGGGGDDDCECEGDPEDCDCFEAAFEMFGGQAEAITALEGMGEATARTTLEGLCECGDGCIEAVLEMCTF